MLQVAPATKNIVVVVGATPLEHIWREVFQKAAEPVANRINFTYYSDLSFDQMLQAAAKLPPNSFIFVLLLLRDASGVTHNADEALQHLHRVANAPINGIFDHQLGLGIVGGRLYQSERIGKEAADIAVRILRGEPASSFSPILLERLAPRYDSRELERWKIQEKISAKRKHNTFSGSDSLGTASHFNRGCRYRRCAASIAYHGFVANLVKRHRAERSLTAAEEEARRHREQINLLGRVSLLGEMTASLAHELNQPLSPSLAMPMLECGLLTGDGETLRPCTRFWTDVVADGHRAHEIIQNVRNTIKKGDSTGHD
jgi:hypothetical protein